MLRSIEVARLLRRGAIALLALFIGSTLMGLGPLLPDPAQALLRFCERLVAHGALPVLALCLLAISLLLDEGSAPALRLLGWVRRRAPLLVLLWLLVVPLQLAAGWWHWQDLGRRERDRLEIALGGLVEVRRLVAAAPSLPALERLHAQLPAGAPPLDGFGPGLAERRSGLLAALDPVPERLQRQSRSQRWQQALTLARRLAGTCLSALGLACLFHAAGRAERADLQREPRRLWPRRRPRRRERELAAYLEELADSAPVQAAVPASDQSVLASDPRAGSPP